MLVEYRKDPFDLDIKKITFETVFYKLEKELEILVENGKMSESNLKNIHSVFKNQLQSIHKKSLLEIKTKELQRIINDSNVVTQQEDILKLLVRKFMNMLL